MVVVVRWQSSIEGVSDRDILLRKSSRTMTSLSGGECHNRTKKRVGCDSHIEIDKSIDKSVILKWRPSNYTLVKIDKCHDVTEEEDGSSNTPYNVYIEAKMETTSR